MSDPNLITTYNFQGRPYLVKMNVTNGCLELILTSKQSGEEWECSYDVLYIENLTRKTGNFKQFEIFITMLRSGLLKTSDCIELDLLASEELESMRLRRIRNYSSTRINGNSQNRKYLIVTYSVEFDRINYPLPLEYCGPPDPIILQATIRRLESELDKANDEMKLKKNSSEKTELRTLQKRLDQVSSENIRLQAEVKHLTKIVSKNPNDQVQTFQKAIKQIEKNLVTERSSHYKLLEKLQNEKLYLTEQLDKVKTSEKMLKSKLQTLTRNNSKSNGNNYQTKHIRPSKSIEPTVDFIFQRKKTPLVRKNNRKVQVPAGRSRSASPRIINDGQWQQSSGNPRLCNTSKSRSRSSSISSTKQSNRQSSSHLPWSPEMNSLYSPRRSRKTSPASGRSSVQSYSSKTQRNKRSTPVCSRSVSPNVTTELEMRVQKMFQRRTSTKF